MLRPSVFASAFAKFPREVGGTIPYTSSVPSILRDLVESAVAIADHQQFGPRGGMA